MMPGLRLPELIILLVIVLLFFGAKRLPEMGASIGKSINAFRKGMSETRHDPETPVDETKALEAKRLELEELERKLTAKKAEATAYEAQKETRNV